jgi:hypothetical protein
LLTEEMAGGIMDICTAPDGESVLVSTSDGEVVALSATGSSRTIISGLPCITAMALGV